MDYYITTRNFLIIEDNQGDFVLIKDYLNEEFLEPAIEQAKTFTAAKEYFKNKTSFDTILLDLSLPDANGELLVHEMVQLAGQTPIIVLTGYSDKDFGIKTLSLGISDYLLKDELTAAQLHKSIAYSIERRRINSELKESEENYRNLFDLSPVPMCVYNWETYKFLNVNKAAVERYGYSKKEFLAMTLSDLMPVEDQHKTKEETGFAVKIKDFKKGVFRHIKKNGEIIDVEIHSDVYSAKHKSRLILCNDITANVYQKNLLALEKKVYELNATVGISYKEVLDTFIQNIETILPSSFCTVQKKEEDDTIHNLAGGSMPPAFPDITEGTLIGPFMGPGAAAMHTGRNIIITDFNADPVWQTYQSLVQPFGFIACWAVPIKKSDGNVLGSFAAYFKTIKYPMPHHINLLERAAGMLGILMENRNAVEGIKKWNERYNVVAKATSDIIWDWDFTNGKILWNKGLINILGYQILNDTTSAEWWMERIHADDYKRVTEKINYFINNKIIKWQDDYRFLCADGSYKYILDRGFLLLDENNKALRMIGAMQDISRQKEEEHHLKLLESVITNTSDAVIITNVNCLDDADHKIIYTNEAFSNMTGYSVEEIIGKTPKLFQGSKTNRSELKRLKKAIKKWETCEIEVINYKKNGEEFWNNITISPVADSTGSFTHWIAIERDITLRKKKDQEITKAIINTQEHERFQIGGELHDNVNQILAGVLLNLGMTKSRPETEQGEWIDKSIGYIHLAITEIRKLTHQLAPVSFDENSLKDTFEKLLKSININNRFMIKFSIDEVGNMQIDGGIQLNLYRILQEQVNNIMKYSQASIIEITLTLVNDAIRLRIYDNGIGFDIKKIKYGIGLHNIKKRTELFSGNFLLKTFPGKGCEIVVEIPML